MNAKGCLAQRRKNTARLTVLQAGSVAGPVHKNSGSRKGENFITESPRILA
jgi:hypothetical protein